MLQLRRGNLQSGERPAALTQIVIACERVEREGVSIQVILQIKNTGETGAGKFRLVPGPIGILLLEEPCHGSLNRRIIRTSSGQQTNQAPSGLRRSALSFAFQRRIIIRKYRHAETT